MKLQLFHHLLIIYYTFRYQVRFGLLEAIAISESGGRNLGIHPDGISSGMFGVTPIVLQEWNNNHPNDKIIDRVPFRYNLKIASWYIGKRIPAMIKAFRKQNTVANRLIAYNAGISYVKNGSQPPRLTLEYVEKVSADMAKYQFLYYAVLILTAPLVFALYKFSFRLPKLRIWNRLKSRV